MAKVLVIEDDQVISRSVQEALSGAGFLVDAVHDGAEGFYLAKHHTYDLLVLDWNLPGKSGLEVMQELRQHGTNVRILMLTAHTALDDKISAFGAGADDYLSKPFEIAELLVRVQAIMRRPEPTVQEVISAKALELHLTSGRVICGGTEIKLQPTELALLSLFMKHPGQVFSTKQLLDSCWKSLSESSEGVIRYHINGLRKKIDHGGITGSYLETIHGLGYRFVEDGTAKKPTR